VRVLVVDDDLIVLASCRRVLEAAGFAVATAVGMTEAVVALVEQGFGLIVVDIKMPQLDGLQLIKKVRAWRTPIPVIAMSGYPTSEMVLSSLAGGAFAFLPKPFTPDELLAALQVVVPAKTNGRGSS
jgi:DNA-binding NtrC family response regulator